MMKRNGKISNEDRAAIYASHRNGAFSAEADKYWRGIETALDILSDADSKLAHESLMIFAGKILHIANWPSKFYMIFLESWGSLSDDIKTDLLVCFLSNMSLAPFHPANIWYLDEANELGLYSLLHLGYIEEASLVSDEGVRAYAAYSFANIPAEYWSETEQHQRYLELMQQFEQDESDRVRKELG
jgi:hypothetical protein